MLNRWSQNERDRSRGLGLTGTRVESIRLLFYASVLVVSDAMSGKFYWGMQKFLPLILPLRGEVCNFFRYISMKGKVTLLVPFLSRGKLHPEDILATHSTKEVLMEMNTCAEQMAYHSDPKAEVMDGWNKTHVHETALVSGGTRML